MVGFIIILAIVGGVYYFYKSSPMSDSKAVKNRCKNRSAEQKKVIRYFAVDGCLSKTISDSEYDSMVTTAIAKVSSKQQALKKIGLDEDELKEIEPVHFAGWWYDGKKTYAKPGKDGKWRSSAYQSSWVFFGDKEVHLYQYTINLDEDGKKELTEGYFYKDITSFATSNDTEEVQTWDKNKKEWVLKPVDAARFQLTVPGAKLYCAMDPNDAIERAVQGMKAKLREKKSV
jgi:hypothetical protein